MQKLIGSNNEEIDPFNELICQQYEWSVDLM